MAQTRRRLIGSAGAAIVGGNPPTAGTGSGKTGIAVYLFHPRQAALVWGTLVQEIGFTRATRPKDACVGHPRFIWATRRKKRERGKDVTPFLPGLENRETWGTRQPAFEVSTYPPCQPLPLDMTKH